MKKPTTIYINSYYVVHFDSKADAKRWQAKQKEITDRNNETIKKLHNIKWN